MANEEERVLPVRTPVAIGEQGEEEERPLGRQSSFEEHQQQTLDDEDEFSESEDDGGNASSAHGDADAAGAPNKNKRRSNFIETVYGEFVLSQRRWHFPVETNLRRVVTR